MELHSIYGLFSTREPKKIRYVGQTKEPTARLKTHHRDASNGKKNILYDWVRMEIQEGYHIRMTILDQCDMYEKNSLERSYIEKYKEHLLNTTANNNNSPYILHNQLSAVKEELEKVKESKVEKVEVIKTVVVEKEVIVEKVIEKKVYAEPTYVNTNLPGENRKMRRENKTLQQPYMDAFRLLNGG
jgi:hypothetical protein